MPYVTRKSGKPPIWVEPQSSDRTDKRFSSDEYDRPYSDDSCKSGYCHKLPVGWREHIKQDPEYAEYADLDSVMWFTNEGTEFTVLMALDVPLWLDASQEERDAYSLDVRWLMVCCPIQPFNITREQTNKYWQGIKSNLPPDPEYPRIIDYIKVQEFPTIDDYIKGSIMPFGQSPINLRFQPQYRVLRTMPTSNEPSFDYWVAQQMVKRQISYQLFCSAATKQLFCMLRDSVMDSAASK